MNVTKLLKLKSLKTEKEQFVDRHSDLIRFLERNFGGEINEGDELTIIYSHRGGLEESVTAQLTAEDIQVIQAISKVL